MEKQDTDLWRKKPGVERLNPAMQWKHHVSLQWRAQDVRVVHKALPMGIYRWSDSRRPCSRYKQAQDVRVVHKARQEFSQSLPRLVSHLPGSQICSHYRKPTSEC